MTEKDGLNPWAEIVGPCFTTTTLARTMGWTEAEVSEAAEALRLLRLHTDDGKSLFPAFQLHEGDVVEGLQAVLRVLRSGVDDPWTWAQWLNTETYEPHSRRPIEMLGSGQIEQALRDAHHDAWAWRS